MRLSSVIAGTGVLVALVVVAPPANAQPSLTDQSVTVTVTDVLPTTPAYTEHTAKKSAGASRKTA